MKDALEQSASNKFAAVPQDAASKISNLPNTLSNEGSGVTDQAALFAKLTCSKRKGD
jgi:hypothetical protein